MNRKGKADVERVEVKRLSGVGHTQNEAENEVKEVFQPVFISSFDGLREYKLLLHEKDDDAMHIEIR